MTALAPTRSLTHRTLRESSSRALRVFRAGMWILLAILLLMIARNYRTLRDRMEFMDAIHAVVSNCNLPAKVARGEDE